MCDPGIFCAQLLEVWENVAGGVILHTELALSRKDGLQKFDRPFRKSSGQPYFLDNTCDLDVSRVIK